MRHARPSRPADDDDRARAGRCSASRRRTVGPSPRRPPCWLRWPLARAIAQLPGPHAATAQCLDLWRELAACRWRGAARRARGGLNGACWARRERWPAAGTSDATTACTGSTAKPVCGLHDRFCEGLTMGAHDAHSARTVPGVLHFCPALWCQCLRELWHSVPSPSQCQVHGRHSRSQASQCLDHRRHSSAQCPGYTRHSSVSDVQCRRDRKCKNELQVRTWHIYINVRCSTYKASY